jgi:hypothetical protein
MLPRIVGVTDLQRRFRAVFDDVAERRIAYVLTRGSRPEAAMIPYDDFVRFQALQEQQVLDRFDRLMARLAAQNAAYTEDEVAQDVAAARHAGK